MEFCYTDWTMDKLRKNLLFYFLDFFFFLDLLFIFLLFKISLFTVARAPLAQALHLFLS